MEPEPAWRIVGRIIGGTRGWSDESGEMLFELVSGWDDIATAAEVANKVVFEWTEEYPPTLADINAMYQHRMNEQARKQRALTGPTVGCPGSGWNEGVPCRLCNPYVYEVYLDSEKWDLYHRKGVPLQYLNDDVTWDEKSRKLVGSRGMPAPCRVEEWHDPEYTITPLDEGYRLARRSYEDDCREQGKEPNWRYFDKVMRSIRSATDPLQVPTSVK